MEGLALNTFHGLMLFNCPNVLKCRIQRDILKDKPSAVLALLQKAKPFQFYITVLKSWQSCTWITSFQLSYQPMEWILLSICSISPGRKLQLWNANLPKVTRPQFQNKK